MGVENGPAGPLSRVELEDHLPEFLHVEMGERLTQPMKTGRLFEGEDRTSLFGLANRVIEVGSMPRVLSRASAFVEAL